MAMEKPTNLKMYFLLNMGIFQLSCWFSLCFINQVAFTSEPPWRSIGTKLKYVMLPRARADKGAGLREQPGGRGFLVRFGWSDMGVEPKIGKFSPKMDAENNGKPLLNMG